MVLYKRKQVQVTIPTKPPRDPSTEVWFIPQTNEWFTNYDDYLSRMDYYHRKKFVCEITGNSCLTFFEALESEIKEVKDVERNFPEALKGHILRFLQFNRITRLDQLVDKVYLQFKNNYFPGEYVLLKNMYISGGAEEINSMRQRGLIREKVEPVDSPAKYLVVRLADNQQAITTGDKLTRDRNHFTKWLIKTFIKLTMARSHKIGAPWVVKDKYAKRYRIDQEYPEDLKQFEASTATDDGTDDSNPNLMRHFSYGPIKRPVDGRKRGVNKLMTPQIPTPQIISVQPAVPSLDKKVAVHNILDSQPPATLSPLPKVVDRKKFPIHYFPDHLRNNAHTQVEGVNCNRPGTITTVQAWGIPPTKKNMVPDTTIKFDIQNARPIPHRLVLPENSRSWNLHLLKLIEQQETQVKTEQDQDKEDDVVLVKSEDDSTVESDESLLAIDRSKLSSKYLANIEQALECWTFINIYHSPLNIDNFTFDDFIYCMGWNYDQFSEVGRCELLDEIWCSLLGAIVSNKIPTASELKSNKYDDDIYGLEITLPTVDSFINPKLEEEDDDLIKGSESEDEHVKSFTDAEENESDFESNKFKKEPSTKVEDLNGKPEIVDDADDEGGEEEDDDDEENEETKEEDEKEDDSDDDEPRDHNAYQIMNHRGVPWHDRLRKRNFKDGNWQTILLGVLSLVDDIPKYEKTINLVFKIMAPIGEPATATTALNQFYSRMDINLRLETLSILCQLLSTSDLVRSHIDKSLEESTHLRRSRLDNIKEYRSSLEKAQALHNQVYEKYLELTNSSLSEEELKRKPRFDTNSRELSETEAALASSNSVFADLCEERKMAFIKLEELRSEKRTIERQLVEKDCQRVRCLGKDRLYNRYWWFESNGLPTLHGSADADEDNEHEKLEDDPEDSDEVLEETYLMGTLWVQGPLSEDVKIHLNADGFSSYTNDGPDGYIQRVPTEDTSIIHQENKQVEELDYSRLPSNFTNFAKENFGFNYLKDCITKTTVSGQQDVVVDKFGELQVPYGSLNAMEQKLIEECPDPLIKPHSWRYFDKYEDVDKVLKWLNPYGIRESQLKKELTNVNEAIRSSIEARQKALSQKEKIEEQTKIQQQLEQVEARLQSLSSNPDSEDEDDDIELKGRKRALRQTGGSNKRQKTFEEVIKTGVLDEVEELKKSLEMDLQKSQEDREMSRALEWVNSLAIEKFDKSLYDGGDKAKTRAKK